MKNCQMTVEAQTSVDERGEVSHTFSGDIDKQSDPQLSPGGDSVKPQSVSRR